MGSAGFDIVVLGATGSPQDWGRALQAPTSALPALDAAQRQSAKRRGVSEQDYARGVLLEQLAEQRWQQRGLALGEMVREAVKPLESEYRLRAVVAEVQRKRWTVRFVDNQGRVLDVHLDEDLVEDLLSFNAAEDKEKLRIKLLNGLGRDELVVRK